MSTSRAAGRRIWPEESVWIDEGETTDWRDHSLWVEADAARLEVTPVDEVGVDGMSAGSCSVETPGGAVDLSIVLARGARAAGLVTTSGCASPSAVRGREVVRNGRVDVLAVVSKNANVATPTAAEDTEAIVAALGERFSVPRSNVLLSCTGVIGQRLHAKEVIGAMPQIEDLLSPSGLASVGRGIMTTDPRPKMVTVRFGEITIAGIVKGAGMVEPRMATMLAYLFTNAEVEPEVLQRTFRQAVDKTLNALTIDSDTSTSDTAAILSSGTVPLPAQELPLFEAGVLAVCAALARAVVADAEGGSKILEVEVTGASTPSACRAAARQIANSPLVKAAVNGADPNWGRVVMALGKPGEFGSEHSVEMATLRISIMGVTAHDRGRSIEFDSAAVAASMRSAPTVSIEVELGPAPTGAKIFGCDLSEEYVRFNSIYTT